MKQKSLSDGNCNFDNDQKKTNKIGDEDRGFSSEHVRHDRTDEKTFLAFEDYPTRGAAMLEMERPLDNGCATTGRTPQFETPTQREDNRKWISFHSDCRRMRVLDATKEI